MSATTSTRTGSVPGGEAEKPTEIPARGWFQIVKRGWAEAKEDQVPLLAAGMAYYSFLAIFPTIIAAVLLYSFFADPAQINQQLSAALANFPDNARTLVTEQITRVSGQGGAGIGAIVSILVALFSASGGVSNLMGAINSAYDEDETRGFIKKRGTALLLTLGAIVFVLLVIALVAVLPALLSVFGGGGAVQWLIQIGRWVVIIGVVMVALAVLYRFAPDRDSPKVRWTSVGAGVAAVLFVVASVGFSIYISNFGNNSYTKTYGAAAGFVIVLFWLWIISYAVLLGAEINAESEQQTIKDTTKGDPQPLGDRDAVKADSVPEADAEEEGAGHRRSKNDQAGDDGGAKKDDDRRSAGQRHQSGGDDAPGEHSRSTLRKDVPMTESTQPVSAAVGTSSGGASAIEPVNPADRSTGELIRDLSADLSKLVRDEMRLAQAEVGAKAKKAGIGIGAFGGAGVVALYGLGVLLAAAVLGLANVVSPWLAALIVGVILFIVAGVAALIGRSKLKQAAPPVPTRTIDSVKTDVAEIKESIKK